MRNARLLLAVPLLLCAVSAQAAEVSYDLGLYSAYVWRGLTFTDGAVFQPSVTTSHDSGFSFNVWGNMDIDDSNDLSGEFQEVDLTLSYGFGGDTVSAEVGYIEYLFPNGVGDGTREVYFNLGFDTVLSPSVTLYYDFDEVDDYYGIFGIEYGGEVNENVEWGIGVSAGFAGEDFSGAYGGTDSGLFDGMVSFSITYSKDNVSVGGMVAYTDSLDTDVLPDQEVDFFGGVSVSVSF